jgi:hypothetical protein
LVGAKTGAATGFESAEFRVETGAGEVAPLGVATGPSGASQVASSTTASTAISKTRKGSDNFQAPDDDRSGFKKGSDIDCPL